MRFAGTHRLIASRHPTVGIFDDVASAEDLAAVFELESWSNDRISVELGVLHTLPPSEWVTGRPMSSVIMASFCHPSPTGGRFNGPERGAWYAARSLATAQKEVAYHRTRELREIGIYDTRMQMRLYLADLEAPFYDARPQTAANEALHDPDSYVESQKLAAQLLGEGSPGIVFRSVRHPGGECIACFRPKLLKNVRAAGHFQFEWAGGGEPVVRSLSDNQHHG